MSAEMLKLIDYGDRPIYVLKDGRFVFTHEDGTLTSADTLAKLLEKLERAQKKEAVKVRIPCARLSRYGDTRRTIVKGTITGIHGGTGNLMFRPNGGKVEQLSQWESDGVLRDISDHEIEGFNALLAERNAANERLDAYEESLRFKEIRQAVEDAMSAPANGKAKA